MPKRKLPPDGEVVAMYRSGMSSGEIAERYNVAAVTVISLLRRLNEPRRGSIEYNKIRRERGRNRNPRYWLGKKQPPEMVTKRIAKIKGENHWLWQGGLHSRDYRKNVEKESCEQCGGLKNLGIHHIDFDHYNNVSENLQVLCVGCHMSLHKKAYWDAIHAGKEPPKTNAPIGWRKKGGDI